MIVANRIEHEARAMALARPAPIELGPRAVQSAAVIDLTIPFEHGDTCHVTSGQGRGLFGGCTATPWSEARLVSSPQVSLEQMSIGIAHSTREAHAARANRHDSPHCHGFLTVLPMIQEHA